jgi:septal ring factor EnvC (AmiA/AmiB activator)
MKSKAALFVLSLLTVASLVFAYLEKQQADVLRKDNQELHRKLKRVEQQAEAARAEAAKMRDIAERERAQLMEALNELNKKKK